MINTKGPLISVIMNCHNGSKFINRSVNSIKKQSYKNWELIFGTTIQPTLQEKVIKNIKDKRIKYFFKKINKLYYSRNQAIKKAKGEYICFLDVDDQWKSNKLNKQVQINENGIHVIFSIILGR